MPIKFEKVSHTYSPNTPFSYVALHDISVEIKEKSMSAIIGETGSGKTTLVQHLNALLLPSEGNIEILDRIITSSEKPKHLKNLRKMVGLVFQFPEYQLFEETIFKDIAFGPKNFGMSEEDALEKAKEMMKVVGLDEFFGERSPFELSGGQKRRVAIAGILAMDPEVLVLDEPTAGLDPQGAKDMMNLFVKLNKEFHKTIILVTHDMDHVLTYCEEVIVMKEGRVHHQSNVKEFFDNQTLLDELHIKVPALIESRDYLKQNGYHFDEDVLTLEALIEGIKKEVIDHE